MKQKLLMFDAMDCSVRTIRLRPRQKNCVVCGDEPTLTELVDYEQFCGTKASDKVRICESANHHNYKQKQSLAMAS